MDNMRLSPSHYLGSAASGGAFRQGRELPDFTIAENQARGVNISTTQARAATRRRSHD